MGYFIILLSVLIITIIIGIISGNDFDIAFLIGLLVTIILGGAICLLLSLVIHGVSDSEEYVYSKTKIAALNDNITSNGTFFLGSGSIKGDLTYFYMINEEKGMKVETVNANDAYLIEENRQDGLIEETDYRFKNKTLEYWFPCWYTGDTIIKIPKGSILRNYQVDLK